MDLGSQLQKIFKWLKNSHIQKFHYDEITDFLYKLSSDAEGALVYEHLKYIGQIAKECRCSLINIKNIL